MTSNLTSTHPSFCDPRCCKPHLFPDGSVSYEHRESASKLVPAVQFDSEIVVCRTRLDDYATVTSIGQVNVSLQITDTASLTPHGDPCTIDVDLDPMDARMLAAQLIVVAELVEAAR